VTAPSGLNISELSLRPGLTALSRTPYLDYSLEGALCHLVRREKSRKKGKGGKEKKEEREGTEHPRNKILALAFI